MKPPTALPSTPQADTRPAPAFGTEYRLDLQGIRAVAVLLVLLFHAGINVVSGGFVGVDIFFVLSGYLITGIVAKELFATGSLRLAHFYSRRIIRIIPAATLVLIFTGAATLLWLPITSWRDTAMQTIGSALYVSNWQFAQTTNYLNAATPPSPLQHFWSLAIEEQYYLLWPALLVLGVLLIRRFSRRADGSKSMATYWYAVCLMGAITLTSLVYALWAMQTMPEPTYFVTPSRLWEMGVGSLLALAAPWLRNLSRASYHVLFVAGALAIAYAAFFFTTATPFPGATALVPVLGTAALIASGLGSSTTVLAKWGLENRVMVWVGNLSYALYLWHWPMVTIAEQGFGVTSTLGKTCVVAASVVPAYLSTRFIEKPLLKSPSFRAKSSKSFAVGGIAILVSLSVAATMLFFVHQKTANAPTVNLETDGAASLLTGELPKTPDRVSDTLLPSLPLASDDVPAVYPDGCHLEVNETDARPCAYGAAGGPKMLLVGDSHAAQWFPTLEVIARDRGYQLISMTKSSCPFIDGTVMLDSDNRAYTECATWNEQVRGYIEANTPDLVVTSSLLNYTMASNSHTETNVRQALRTAWEWLAEKQIQTTVLNDTPYMSTVVPNCLANNLDNPSACETPSAEALHAPTLMADAAEGLDGVDVVDLTPYICPGEQCVPIVGDVLVYRDQHHLTATYAKTLAAMLGERMTVRAHR